MRASFLGQLIVVVFFLLGLFTQFSLGGTCFSAMIRRNAGRCTEILYEHVSKEHCCSTSSSLFAAWTPEPIDQKSWFHQWTVRGGFRCEPCKETCQNVKCEQGKVCAMRKGMPKCVCSPSCRDLLNGSKQRRPKGPLCGSDGRTYKNWCRMRKKSCKQRLKNLTVAYYGACQNSCDKIKCSEGKTCLLDQNHVPHCIYCSRRKCPSRPTGFGVIKHHHQVCGSDGLTYRSTCHLRDAACQGGRAIPIAYQGPCRANVTCQTVQCQPPQQCLIDRESGGSPRCVNCQTSCRYYQGPICATNNNTYATWCHMMKDACYRGYIIETKHSGRCMKDKELWA